MDITQEEVRAAGPLGYATQVRFTELQYALLRQVAANTDRKLGSLIRDVVTVWASRHPSADGLVDVEALVGDLQLVADEP